MGRKRGPHFRVGRRSYHLGCALTPRGARRLYGDTTVTAVPHAATAHAATVTLRPDMTPVEDQGPHRASCVSFCVDACLEFLTQRDLSEQYTYWLAQGLGGGGNGLPLTPAADLVRTRGTIAEAYWTYDPDTIGQAPPPPAAAAPRVRFTGVRRFDQTRLDYLETCLRARLPVMAGVRVFSDCGWETGEISLPGSDALAAWRDVRADTNTRITDGWHAILIVGFDAPARMFEFKNSWGASWGDGGYGWMPYGYVTRHCAEACYGWI